MTRSATGARNARRSSTIPSGERMRAWYERSAVRPRSRGTTPSVTRRARARRHDRARFAQVDREPVGRRLDERDAARVRRAVGDLVA